MCGIKACAGTDGFGKEDNFPTGFFPAEDALRNAGSSSLGFKSAGRDKETSGEQAARAFWSFTATKIWKSALSQSHFFFTIFGLSLLQLVSQQELISGRTGRKKKTNYLRSQENCSFKSRQEKES